MLAAAALLCAGAVSAAPEPVAAARLEYSAGCRLGKAPGAKSFIEEAAANYPALLLEEIPYADPVIVWLDKYGRPVPGEERADLSGLDAAAVGALLEAKGVGKDKELLRNILGAVQWEISQFPSIGECTGGWRATADCSARAARHSPGDAPCDTPITPQQSGHCICAAVPPSQRRLAYDCDPDPEWEEVEGDAGRTYYWRESDQRSRWDPPDDWLMDDPTDARPADWEPEHIPDPHEQPPAEWDEEADGEWAAGLVPNPRYQGEWKPRQVRNESSEWQQLEVPGRSYYWNKKEKRSLWDQPQGFRRPRRNFTCVEVCADASAEALLVSAGRHSDKGGAYERVEGERANGQPVWRRVDGRYVIYSTPNGHWSLAGMDVAEDDYEVSAGFMSSRKPHGGAMPDDISAWQTHDGLSLVDDSEAAVHRHARQVRRSSPASVKGSSDEL
eukprot:TRINITY_DN50626_c0_g1_i1.p1 TRINITY_DN50626_c0_g1~~TRINITY_DN50626_c0_g1_i1.p1  ORF type:complete len:474 (+),score=123.68 TRINITY_DN50626_c0_g1_i1:91-1422(+)